MHMLIIQLLLASQGNDPAALLEPLRVIPKSLYVEIAWKCKQDNKLVDASDKSILDFEGVTKFYYYQGKSRIDSQTARDLSNFISIRDESNTKILYPRSLGTRNRYYSLLYQFQKKDNMDLTINGIRVALFPFDPDLGLLTNQKLFYQASHGNNVVYRSQNNNSEIWREVTLNTMHMKIETVTTYMGNILLQSIAVKYDGNNLPIAFTFLSYQQSKVYCKVSAKVNSVVINGDVGEDVFTLPLSQGTYVTDAKSNGKSQDYIYVSDNVMEPVSGLSDPCDEIERVLSFHRRTFWNQTIAIAVGLVIMLCIGIVTLMRKIRKRTQTTFT